LNQQVPRDLSSNGAPLLFEGIDRTAARLPAIFITWAQLLGRASDQMVRRAKQNCPPYSRRRRWQTVNCGPGQTSIRIESNCTLRVFRRGKLWFAYRTVVSKRQVSGGLLCFVLGPLPICTHTREAIMRLAEYYHFFPGKDGMQWVDIETYSGHFLQPTS
jgi:hypothetical protein